MVPVLFCLELSIVEKKNSILHVTLRREIEKYVVLFLDLSLKSYFHVNDSILF